VFEIFWNPVEKNKANLEVLESNKLTMDEIEIKEEVISDANNLIILKQEDIKSGCSVGNPNNGQIEI
jgi:hypothetical protein